MENREEIMGGAIDEMIYLALEELRTVDEEVRKAAAERLGIRDRVLDDPALDDHGRRMIQRYLELLDDLVDKQYHHLYLQGAKDCVLLLLKLEVIR